MNERRHNWKSELGKAALLRKEQRHTLIVQLDETRRDIQSCGLDFERHDLLKQQQREIIAQLAAL